MLRIGITLVVLPINRSRDHVNVALVFRFGLCFLCSGVLVRFRRRFRFARSFWGAGVGDGALPPTSFFSSSSLRFFFSCLARSSAFVSLVNAIVFPSGGPDRITGALRQIGKYKRIAARPWQDR